MRTVELSVKWLKSLCGVFRLIFTAAANKGVYGARQSSCSSGAGAAVCKGARGMLAVFGSWVA